METADHTGQPEATKAAGDYEQMYALLYAYRFGRITFIELLDKWKEVLHLPASAQQQQAQHEKS